MNFPVSTCCRLMVATIASLLLTGCTYEYTLLVRVIDSSETAVNVNTRIIVMQKAPDEIDLPALVSEPVDSSGELEVRLCCEPNPQVWVYVFVDTDHSLYWEEGEYLQAAQNPLSVTDDETLIIQLD